MARVVLKTGFRFTHQSFLDRNWNPAPGHTMREAPKAEMVVTRVTSSRVWYAYADGEDFQIGASRHSSWVTDRSTFISRYLAEPCQDWRPVNDLGPGFSRCPGSVRAGICDRAELHADLGYAAKEHLDGRAKDGAR